MKLFVANLLWLSSLPILAQNFDLGNGVKIEGQVAPFDSTKHHITRCQVLDWSFKPVCLIDGRPFFGHDLDSAVPRMELVALSVTINDIKVGLEVVGMFNPNGYSALRTDQFKVREAEGGHEVLGLFSDGAGTYVAAWKVMAGGSIRTLISRSEEEVVHWWHDVPYPATQRDQK